MKSFKSLIGGTLLVTALAASIPAQAGLYTNGISINGISINGRSLQGISINGRSLQGVQINGRSSRSSTQTGATQDVRVVAVTLPAASR